MKKWLTLLFLSLFPALVFADDGVLSFAPPATDVSVVFLGNLFGVVDGVLSGTGSQIMGSMFAVFNSAVLAIGGIIIIYTLLVATMNTAHEGQMLGQKWSSVWIPARSTLGLALLIPKASGYCLMQIFVMWVVIQGIGAADKVWQAALSYLNRGGVIVEAQISPTAGLLSGVGEENTPGAPYGALTILTGQVCMLSLQKQLETLRSGYLEMKSNQSGPCYGTPTPSMAIFCNNSIPDFVGSVNAVAYQNSVVVPPTADVTNLTYNLTMPNFINSSPYYNLNGICGTLHWNPLAALQKVAAPAAGTNVTLQGGGGISLSGAELQTAQMSRAIALQQMYIDLSSVAQVIVNNDPQVTPSGTASMNPVNSNDFSLVAREQFGVPFTNTGSCAAYSDGCTTWGPLITGAMLFNGTEFQGAINDYNGIMNPTLLLISEAATAANGFNTRAFIATANAEGWMMAGAYYFDLVSLTGNAVSTQNTVDVSTGLDKSKWGFQGINGSGCTSNPLYAPFCDWFMGNFSPLVHVQSIIDGSNASITPPPSGQHVASQAVPTFTSSGILGSVVAPGILSSSVYGFINNSMMVQLPGQPGTAGLMFTHLITISTDPSSQTLSDMDFDCGPIKIVIVSFCLGRILGKVFYNYIFKNMMNAFIIVFNQFLSQLLMAVLTVPLTGMAQIFQNGVTALSQSGTNTLGVNPIVGLANMGIMYINFSSNLWMNILMMAVNPFFWFAIPLVVLCMPLLIGWIVIMVGIGFITAYYIPILPYMIFTFGALAWLISVIEAMVAAPIVALGVTHPEGHDAFGKGEQAIMLLMNVFLRPALMIIGYISGIALSYVGVWLLNTGFDHAIGFVQNGGANSVQSWGQDQGKGNATDSIATTGSGNIGLTGSVGYTSWAGVYAYFFAAIIYTTMYLTIVQQAFTLISVLPDKVLRWIGGTPDSIGQESARWGDELKGKVTDSGKAASDAQAAIGKTLTGGVMKKAGDKATGKGGGGGASATGESTPPTPPPV